MRTLVCTLVLSVCVFYAKAQINLTHNGIRIGDEIIKQQVEYKEPGEPGINRIWDFSKLKTINDAYSLNYDLPPLQGDSLYILGDRSFLKKETKEGELIVGTEHNTMYHYRLRHDTLYLLGHENPAVRLTYTQPIVYAVYPLNYGNHSQAGYTSEGLYSGTVELATKGHVKVEADAFGKLILPTGDTLNPILRIKTTKLIQDREIQKDHNNDISTDTAIKIKTQTKGKQMETCQWYTKGYRYPVFETIRNINLDDNSEIFSTAFYYPLQEHYYLDTDPENLALLDSLWNQEDERKTKSSTLNIAENTSKDKGYRIYPNPVESTLYIEHNLEETSNIKLQLFSMEGKLVKLINRKNQKVGYYTEKIDCSNIPTGSYILKVTNGSIVVTNEKIIKK